jgi:hypothetical protein
MNGGTGGGGGKAKIMSLPLWPPAYACGAINNNIAKAASSNITMFFFSIGVPPFHAVLYY